MLKVLSNSEPDLKALNMFPIARTRADVDIRLSPKSTAKLVDRLPSDCPVEILEELDDWYKVKPARILHGSSGYLPDIALTFPNALRQPVFPVIPTAEVGSTGPSVPPSLPLSVFMKWLPVGGKPGWISEAVWTDLSKAQQAELIEKIRAASSGLQSRWNDWLTGLEVNLRLEDASMNEWIVMMEGGREVYAIRDHYVYIQPVQDASYFGCALKGQIMRWTGVIRKSEKYGKSRNFYEVDFYRMSRIMHGWFRADVAAQYNFPIPELDPTIESNAQTVFDLSKPILRHPQDQAISESKRKGYIAAQYIDVHPATNKHLLHFSLCGEFCVAALGKRDVLPLLKEWLESKYWRVPTILHDANEGTCTADLQSLLELTDLKGEVYSSIPTSPQLIKEKLASGMFAIVGCGISGSGKIKADGKIRHWVVLEDLIPSGNSGWVRVYNPFNNREEVYNYNLFITSSGVGAGLWISAET